MKSKYKITIEFEAGSEYQDELFESQLKVVLSAIELYHSHSHKKNKVYIRMERRDE